VFNLGGNIAYNNNISYLRDSLDNASKNTGKNWVVGQRLSTDIKIKKWLETNFTVNFSLNSNDYSLQDQLSSTTRVWSLSNHSRFFLPKDFILTYDIDKTINSGYSTNVIENPLIITASLEKQFLKKKNLSLKFQALDMLNQNIGISRTVSATGFTDSRTNRLGRYFMLTAIFRLNKFFGDTQGAMQMGMPMHGGGEMMGKPF
jgi:hypothetical protein